MRLFKFQILLANIDLSASAFLKAKNTLALNSNKKIKNIGD